MIKFELIVPTDVALSLQNRAVCDVVESHTKTQLGQISSWRGSVETEYFSIIFMNGMLVVSLEERECNLGKNPISYALSVSLSEAIKKAKETPAEAKDISEAYNTQVAPKEQGEISFTDVMVILGWRYANENVKVDYDLLTN